MKEKRYGAMDKFGCRDELLEAGGGGECTSTPKHSKNKEAKLGTVRKGLLNH